MVRKFSGQLRSTHFLTAPTVRRRRGGYTLYYIGGQSVLAVVTPGQKGGRPGSQVLGLSPLPAPCRPLQSPILFHASPTPADKKISFSHTDHFIWPGMAASNLREMAGATGWEEGYLGEELGRLGAARRPTGRTSKGRQSMRIRRCPVPPPSPRPPPRPVRAPPNTPVF